MSKVTKKSSTKKKIDASTSSMVWSRIVDEATSNIIASLIQNETVSEKYFLMVSKILLPKHLKEIIFERSCDGKCGNQFCSKKPQKTYHGKYYFGNDGKIHETDENLKNSFCSKTCFDSSIRILLNLDESPPQSRDLKNLLKLVFPDLNVDDIFSKTVDRRGVVKLKVEERKMEDEKKIENPNKNGAPPITIEGFIPKDEQQKYKENIESIFEPDEEKLELPKLSLYGEIWNAITRLITLETREYLVSKNEQVQDSLFQVFDENKLERLEFVDTILMEHFKIVCEEYHLSNMESISKKFKQIIYTFDLNRSINPSLEKSHWMIIVFILLKCFSENDLILEKEIKCLELEIENNFGLKFDQFLILSKYVMHGE